MGQKPDLIVGLDIGTTKVSVVVGETNAQGSVDIVGVGQAPSRGLRKGVVINIEDTVGSVRQAVEKAEASAGCDISHVYTGISGGHIKGFNSHGVVALKGAEVTEHDIQRVLDAARAVAIPLDRDVLHVLPQEFIMDGQGGIRDPLGMSGVRLEAKVHIVTGAVTSAQNIVKCAQRCGLTVLDVVLEQLASSEAVLTEDEKNLGVALLDMGGGTSDIAVWSGGSIVHTAVLPLGGEHITHDIAVGLRTPVEDACVLKEQHGCAMPKMAGRDERVHVNGVGGRGGREIHKQLLCGIIEPRVEEILLLVQQELMRTGYYDVLAGGVVLTGGAALLAGMVELSEEVLGLPVRLGKPARVGGVVDAVQSPAYATAVGLVWYGKNHANQPFFSIRALNAYKSMGHKMRTWLSDIF